MKIDLHTHSRFSDGTFSPAEIIQQAVKKNISIISLTDHDTIDGNDEFLAEAKKLNINAIAGLEISVDISHIKNLDENCTMHILGYFPNWNEKTKKSLILLEKIRQYRNIRNPKIIEKLKKLGYNITLDEVMEIANNDVVGRPHIATLLIKKGIVKSMGEAFRRFLAKGAKAYVARLLLNPKDAIEMILNANGIPVLAHPYSLHISSDDNFGNVIEELINYGLRGLEVITGNTNWINTQKLLGYTYIYELIATAGSDFHGNNKSDVQLGISIDNLETKFHKLFEMCNYIN